MIREALKRSPSKSALNRPQFVTSRGIDFGRLGIIPPGIARSMFTLLSFPIKQAEKMYIQGWVKPRELARRGELKGRLGSGGLQRTSEFFQVAAPVILNSALYFHLKNARALMIHQLSGNEGEPTGYDPSPEALAKHVGFELTSNFAGFNQAQSVAAYLSPELFDFEPRYGKSTLEDLFGTGGAFGKEALSSGKQLSEEFQKAYGWSDDELRERLGPWNTANRYYLGGVHALFSGARQVYRGGGKTLPAPFPAAPAIQFQSKKEKSEIPSQQALYLKNEAERLIGDVPSTDANEKDIEKFLKRIHGTKSKDGEEGVWAWFYRERKENPRFGESFRGGPTISPEEYMRSIIGAKIAQEYNLGTTPKRINLRDRDTFPSSGELQDAVYNARMISRMPEEIAELYASSYRTESKRLIIKTLNKRSGRDILRFLGLPTKLEDYHEEKAKQGWLNNYVKSTENIEAYKNIINSTDWEVLREEVRSLLWDSE